MTVRSIADEIAASLTGVVGMPKVPPFNEVTWSLIPKAAVTSPPTVILRGDGVERRELQQAHVVHVR